MKDNVINFEEEIIFKLRLLYKKYGYLPYKMSKFEEYELYAENKNFLVSDRVITFNDTNGKLMALKPDVTLSIIKNGEDIKGVKQKLFYDENVYRVSKSTGRFKEILQTGLECIGDIDLYDVFEVINLAAKSLATISDDFYIEIGNLDIVYSLVSSICSKKDFIYSVNECLSQKNTHDLKNICENFGVSEEDYKKIATLVFLSGKRNEVIEKLQGFCDEKLLEKMKKLSSLLDKSQYSDKIRFDFSLISDMNYYNGFVFNGYIDGIYCSVLSGGQYGKLMKMLNRSCQAIGFALYMDNLTDIDQREEELDADYLLLYDENTDVAKISEKVNELINQGFSVNAQKVLPPKFRYRQIIDIKGNI